jgi:hypothetical protein
MQFWCSSLILQSWRWCLRCGSVVVSSKGKNKVNQNCRKQTRKNLTKCPKFKCNTVSVSFSACRCSSVVVSSKVGREKKKQSGDTAPAFSGLHVYLQLMWEVGLPPPPVEFSFHCCFYKLFYS